MTTVALGAVACGPQTVRGPSWVAAYEPIAQLGDIDCLVARDGRLACGSEIEARAAATLPEPVVQFEANAGDARCAVLQSGRVACWGCTGRPLDLMDLEPPPFPHAPLKSLLEAALRS